MTTHRFSPSLICVVVSFTSLLVACVLLFCDVYKQNKVISSSQTEIHSYQSFLSENFLNPISSDEIHILDSLSVLDGTKILVFAPSGICSSCMINVMLALKEDKRLNETALYYAPGSQMLVAESKMRGFQDINIVKVPGSESMTSILVRKIDDYGIYYYLKLSSSNPDIFKLFLHFSVEDGLMN